MPIFPKKAQEIIDTLRTYSFTDLSTLLGTSDTLTKSTLSKIKAFALPCTLQNSKQAICTFQGDAYSAIRSENYTSEQLFFAQNTLYIISGLYGILRPLDLMQPYRLEMGTRLKVGDCKNLYQFWQETITKTISQSLSQHDDPTLINLASSEYSKAVIEKNLQARMITIIFKQKIADSYKSIPVYSKRARGMMIHYIIINGIKTSERLKAFQMDGYQYSVLDSTADNWVFCKN